MPFRKSQIRRHTNTVDRLLVAVFVNAVKNLNQAIAKFSNQRIRYLLEVQLQKQLKWLPAATTIWMGFSFSQPG